MKKKKLTLNGITYYIVTQKAIYYVNIFLFLFVYTKSLNL